MKVLVTGADGFIGKNLVAQLLEKNDIQVVTFLKNDTLSSLKEKVVDADFIFHLAGINRPQNEVEFKIGNADLTEALCGYVQASDKLIPIVYASSVQAELDNAYGMSKRMAEQALLKLSALRNVPTYIYRLPNVFGKWCKPNYNSVVATFCHNIVHDLPIQVNNPATKVDLVYVDDVVAGFIQIMKQKATISHCQEIQPIYTTTLGELAECLYFFKNNRTTLIIDSVGIGFTRALYATFISYFAPEKFSYHLKKHEDQRGVFVEMLKTKDAGQFSYFTAHPGVTRGGHYHHTKNEKFLVVKGQARFRFRHIVTGETYEYLTNEHMPEVVETVPGWSHDVTNVGNEEMIVMLWANEVFDPQRPDTYSYKV